MVQRVGQLFGVLFLLIHFCVFSLYSNPQEMSDIAQESSPIIPVNNARVNTGQFVHGQVKGIWTKAKSPYIVDGDCTVSFMDSLVIEAGVQVRFQSGFGIRVKGRLRTKGTKQDSVIFTSDKANASPGDWQGIDFSMSFSNLKSQLNYSVVEFADIGITVFTNVIVKNSSIRHNRNGIASRGPGSSIDSCYIISNEENGVIYDEMLYYPNYISSIKNSYIGSNGKNGITTSAFAQPLEVEIRKCYIVQNTMNGIYCYGENNHTSANYCTLYNNGKFDWYNNSSDSLDGQYNDWGEPTTTEMNEVNYPGNITKIYDGLDQPGLGLIKYAGWLGRLENGFTGVLALTNEKLEPIGLSYPRGTGKAFVRLEDTDLNLHGDSRDTVSVVFFSPLDSLGERVLLRETSNQSAVFTGSIALDVLPGLTIKNSLHERLNRTVSKLSTKEESEARTKILKEIDEEWTSLARQEAIGQVIGDGILQIRNGQFLSVTYFELKNANGKKEQIKDRALLGGWSGTVSGSWNKEFNPYIVTENINVPRGQALTINPGVIIQFYPGVSLTVQGRFESMGTAIDSVMMTAYEMSDEKEWDGINILTDIMSSQRTVLRYTAIRHALYGINTSLAAVELTNCSISHCGSAIDISLNNPFFPNIVRDCMFSENDVGVQFLFTMTGWPLDNCTFTRNQIGVEMRTLQCDTLKIKTPNQFINNYKAGLIISGCSYIAIDLQVFKDNPAALITDGALALHLGDKNLFENNLWPLGISAQTEITLSSYLPGANNGHSELLLIGNPFPIDDEILLRKQTRDYALLSTYFFNDLRISPGVNLRFGGNASLSIDNHISAIGTPEQPITFTALDADSSWRGLRISNEANAVLRNCHISSASSGLQVNGGAEISDCRFFNNTDDAIVLSSEDDVKIYGCQIYQNGGAGIKVHSTVSCSIENNLITANEYGIELFDGSDFLIRLNHLLNNRKYDLQNLTWGLINATQNFWGPVTTTEMEAEGDDSNIQAVYDGRDASQYGRVLYAPWLRNIPSVVAISHDNWTNKGNIQLTIYGQGFQPGAAVQLNLNGFKDIVAYKVEVVDSTRIIASLDLTDRSLGAWDVAVINPDGKKLKLPAAFTIDEGRVNLWSRLTGRRQFRLGRENSLILTVGNSGSREAPSASLLLRVPRCFKIKIESPQLQKPYVADLTTHHKESESDSIVTLECYLGRMERLETRTLKLSLTPVYLVETINLATAMVLNVLDVTGPVEERELVAQIRIPDADLILNSQNRLYVTINDEKGWEYSVNRNTSPPTIRYWRWRRRHPYFHLGGIVYTFISTENPKKRKVYPETEQHFEIYKTERMKDLNDDGVILETRKGDIPGVTICTRILQSVFADGYWLRNDVTDAQLITLGKQFSIRAYTDVGGDCITAPDSIAQDKKGANIIGGFVDEGEDEPYRADEFALAFGIDPATLPSGCLSSSQVVILPKDCADPCSPNILLYSHINSNPNLNDNFESSYPSLSPFQDFYQGEDQVCFPDDIQFDPFEVEILTSIDPNEKAGPEGYGGTNALPIDEPLTYLVYFENLANATAPAQEISIRDTLDADLDWTTLTFGDIQFGDTLLHIGPGSKSLDFSVVLTDSTTMAVRAAVDQSTGIADWHFLGKHVDSGELADLLPPNRTPPQGEGHVEFTIDALKRPSGTQIHNRASIVFDVNRPLMTNTVFNTLDSQPPSSRITAYADTTASNDFSLIWQAMDDSSGAGIKTCTIYISENGGPYSSWQIAGSSLSANYIAQPDHSYAFYTVATDSVGNMESVPNNPDLLIFNARYQYPAAGWYLISLMNAVSEDSLASLLPVGSQAFCWNPVNRIYEPAETLNFGRGYWLGVASPVTVVRAGEMKLERRDHYLPGWHLIGGLHRTLGLDEIYVSPRGAMAGMYNWDQEKNTYMLTDSLQPGQGEWIAMLCEGDISFGKEVDVLDTLSLETRNTLLASFYHEYGTLPPAPPRITKVADSQIEIPKSFNLGQNYPNPFNGETVIRYQVPEAAQVTIKIYNIMGQLVKTLVDQTVKPGFHQLSWDGRGHSGQRVATGVYYCKMEAPDYKKIRKLMLLR